MTYHQRSRMAFPLFACLPSPYLSPSPGSGGIFRRPTSQARSIYSNEKGMVAHIMMDSFDL